MTTETEPKSESQMCIDCANLNSALCDDVCHDKSEWKSKQKGRKKAKDEPGPTANEAETVEQVEEPRKCSDCDDINSAERCIYCSGDPNTDRAGDKFIPEDGPEAVEVEPVEAPEDDEPNWDTYHDRSAEAPDLMLEEGQGEPQHALVPVSPAPWWAGGPLDTVTPEGESIGLPWHTAVLKLPKGRHLILLPGSYNYGGRTAHLSPPGMMVDEPEDPDTVITGMLLISEIDAKAAAEESSRTEYRPGHNGQSTLDGEPLVRGSIERNPVVQVCITVDKFLLRTTEEGMEKAVERAYDKGPMELEQWIYRKMRPIGKDTVIGKDDWAEGMRQLRKVIEEVV